MKKLFDLHRKSKMSSVAIITACLALLLVTCAPAFALEVQADLWHPSRVVDEADLLTADEEESLLGYVDEISENHQFDVVIVTLDSLDGEDIQYYAADYYDYNGYGMGDNFDGAMFIMSMEEREWFILTTGYGIDVLTDSELDSIGEEMVSYLSSGEYAQAFQIFADEVQTEVEYGVEPEEEPTPNILMSIGAGLFFGLIPALIMRGKLKSVRMQTSAGRYENRGSRNITTRQDIFLYHTVNRVPRETESRSGGGSSTFSGSSGRSHGGRGGGF